MMVLGRLYENGIGCVKNLSRAAESYSSAANNGLEPYAFYKLGTYYEQGVSPMCANGIPDREKALEYYNLAQKFGLDAHEEDQIKEAQFKLGEYKHFGYGVEEVDLGKAKKLYESAAFDNHIESMNALGRLYLNDEKDFENAVVWFEKAAEKGYTRAINNLAICYHHGYGVQKDPLKAIKLYEESANKGYIQSMQSLGLLYLQQGVQNVPPTPAQRRTLPSFVNAQRWFRQCLKNVDSLPRLTQKEKLTFKKIKSDCLLYLGQQH